MYISGVERGERNISILNIDKIAKALQVSTAYIFSEERFSAIPAYQTKDFSIPFEERFSYHLDSDHKLLSFQVKGLFSGHKDVDYLSSVILGICSAYGREELSVLVDHRDMLASDGEPAVYSPDITERAVAFQQELFAYSQHIICLCNSNFMVEQLNSVAIQSGIREKATHVFDRDEVMINKAYSLLSIHDHELIKIRTD